MKDTLVLLDSGDTLVDEATEEKDARGATLRAELIPGAAELLRELSAREYPVALVADGFADTFYNVFRQHGIEHYFDTMVISELLGVEKPDPLMFETAVRYFEATGDFANVVMVGNNLERDILGANRYGIISVWMDWAPRRRKIPREALEEPDYTIRAPLELLDVLGKPLRKKPR